MSKYAAKALLGVVLIGIIQVYLDNATGGEINFIRLMLILIGVIQP